MGALFETGINMVITSQRAIPASLMDPKIKNRSRLFYLMANIEASQVAGDNNWALLLGTDGFITEGTGDNFFIVKDGVVISPEGRDILRGISREYLMTELCNTLGIPCIEKNIGPYDVYTADEAFITGTPFCMLPVTSLNGLAIGDGEVGSIFYQLMNLWSENTGVNIIGQIQKWDSERSISLDGDAPTPYRFVKK
jgi:branched-chain amino acid aminotransferase